MLPIQECLPVIENQTLTGMTIDQPETGMVENLEPNEKGVVDDNQTQTKITREFTDKIADKTRINKGCDEKR